MPASPASISLGELVRLAFPPGTLMPGGAARERAVSFVVMDGPGVTPRAGDLVLTGGCPSPEQLDDWARCGVAGVVLSSALPFTPSASLTVILLPADASLRDVQQGALQLILNRQSYLVERGTRLYQDLARYAVEGGGLAAMARAMFELTGKTVLIQDKRLGPLAEVVAPELETTWADVRGSLSLWNQLPEGMRDRRQAAAGGWRDQLLPGGLMRLVSPIVAKGMARGYLSIVSRPAQLDALDHLVIEHGSAACALEMARAKAVSEVEKRAHGDFVDAVLTFRLPPNELTRWAQRIGYDVEPPHVALVWQWASQGEHADSAAPSLRRLETIINQSVVQEGVSALVRPHDVAVIVFCAVARDARPGAALKLAGTIQAAVAGEYPHHPVYGGIGRPAVELTDWRDSYREATQALSMAARLDERTPLYFGDLSVYRLLFQIKDSRELESFCRETLGALLDYEGGGDLIETLEAYCDRLGNLSQTAEKLFLHRNSLLYRMERISQLTGLDLNNPDTRLAVHLALKVRKMLQPARPRRPNGG